MFIKFILLGLTIILLANEHFKFIDKINARSRRTVLLIIFGFITVLSLVDFHNDDENYRKLEKKSTDIFDKSEEILGRVDNAVNGIDDSNDKMKILDSLAFETNNRLDLAIDKSKELSEIEAKRFYSEKPEIVIIEDSEVDINSVGDVEKIKILIANEGKRSATDVMYHSSMIFYNSQKGTIKFIDSKEPQFNYDFTKGKDIKPDLFSPLTFRPIFNIRELKESDDAIIIVISLKYKDIYSGYYRQTLYRANYNLENNKFRSVDTINEAILDGIKIHYKSNGLDDYLF